MSRLITDKLHTDFLPGVSATELLLPRCYTLTHSAYTGELHLTIGPEYNLLQFSGSAHRFMRDEIVGEWQKDDSYSFHLYCHVSGGVVLGTASLRSAVFKRELPLILEALRYGDRRLFSAHPELDDAPVWVHFNSTKPNYQTSKFWGTLGEYDIRPRKLRKTPVGR